MIWHKWQQIAVFLQRGTKKQIFMLKGALRLSLRSCFSLADWEGKSARQWPTTSSTLEILWNHILSNNLPEDLFALDFEHWLSDGLRFWFFAWYCWSLFFILPFVNTAYTHEISCWTQNYSRFSAVLTTTSRFRGRFWQHLRWAMINFQRSSAASKSWKSKVGQVPIGSELCQKPYVTPLFWLFPWLILAHWYWYWLIFNLSQSAELGTCTPKLFNGAIG